MYDLEALRRKIGKEGVEETIQYLLSPNLPERIKESLTNCSVFSGGYLNLALIYSLV